MAVAPAIDKTLQRLATAGELRRIDRGLYDQPRSKLPASPPLPTTARHAP